MARTESEVVATKLKDLARRSEILRQIHSDKMFRLSRWNRRTNVGLITSTTAVGFIGLSGTDRLRQQLAGVWEVSDAGLDLLYNTVVVFTVLFAIVALIYRLPERVADHHRSIQNLSEFLLEVENLDLLSSLDVHSLTANDLRLATTKYEGLARSLPPVSDKEWRRSKEKLEAKRRNTDGGPSWLRRATALMPIVRPRSRSRTRDGHPATTSTKEPSAPETLEHLLEASPLHWQILGAVEEVPDHLGHELLICGGFVRNLVWDHANGHVLPTPLDDVDVVFVGGGQHSERQEILNALRKTIPYVPWSVQDVTAVKPKYGSGAYTSIESALREFPETASAIAVSRHDERVRVLAPLGLGDLYNGIVRPTAPQALPRLRHRCATKGWISRWPLLQVIDHG